MIKIDGCTRKYKIKDFKYEDCLAKVPNRTTESSDGNQPQQCSLRKLRMRKQDTGPYS